MRKAFSFGRCMKRMAGAAGVSLALGLGAAQGQEPPPATSFFQLVGAVEPQPAQATQTIVQAQAPAPGTQEEATGEFFGDVPSTFEQRNFWTKVPPLSPLPRPGNFIIFPSGCGYYTMADFILGNKRDTPPKAPWAPISPNIFPFYEADFRYLDDPNNTQHDWLDPLKRIHVGDNWLFSFGGEFRYQGKSEYDSQLSGKNNDYDLTRVRLYGDMWFRDRLRLYVEFIDADTFNQNLPPLAIDKNHGDLLDCFVDLKLFDISDNGLYVRTGRQELCYGSQRLISPLDWANTRRTFDGVKGFWHSEKLDVDAFFAQPVLVDAGKFDHPDASRPFAGLWGTYRPQKGQAIDMYYLYLDQHTALGGPGTFNVPGTRSGQDVNTIGIRYSGDYNGSLLWDFEGMYQFGTTNANQSISAGAATTGVGYRFKDMAMTPTFWVYNDYASGDDAGGKGGTFNQLFPFGHYYFGFIDVVGRQNIEDFNLHMYLFPTKWMYAGMQGHFFYLDSARDALYGASGKVLRDDPTGKSGKHVGDEIDLFVNFHLTFHQDLLVGFSELFAGEYIRNTGSPKSPQLFYVQYSYKW